MLSAKGAYSVASDPCKCKSGNSGGPVINGATQGKLRYDLISITGPEMIAPPVRTRTENVCQSQIPTGRQGSGSEAASPH
jgi:hypothetical protein